MCRQRNTIVIYKPRKETSDKTSTLIFDLCHPELWENKPGKPSNMWYFILVAQANNMDDIWQKKKKKISLQCRTLRLDIWIGKIPWRMEWQLTQVLFFLLILFFQYILLYNTVLVCHTSTWIHHGCTLDWEIPWTKEPGRLQSMRLPRIDMTEWLSMSK